MYTGPIMRTYGSMDQYQSDAANMARFGYQVMNVQRDKVTDGCGLTAILIFGLLLAPVCIGLLILLLLPTAFTTRITVHYYYTGIAAPIPHQTIPPGGYYPQQVPPSVPAPVTRQLQPSMWRDGNLQSDSDERGTSAFGGLARYVDQVRFEFGNLPPRNRIVTIVVCVILLAFVIMVMAVLVQAVIQ